MSTYWRLCCRTCATYAETDSINHGDETIAMMVRIADAILRVEGIADHDFDLQVDFRFAPTHWIARHRDHDLVARSEYGEERAIVRGTAQIGDKRLAHLRRWDAIHGLDLLKSCDYGKDAAALITNWDQIRDGLHESLDEIERLREALIVQTINNSFLEDNWPAGFSIPIPMMLRSEADARRAAALERLRKRGLIADGND